MPYERLIYRGNFELTCEIDFAMLSADYGEGYGEDAVVGGGLRAWGLTYSALTRYPFNGSQNFFKDTSRADYIWNFFCASKLNGNEPFVIECPRDGKDYLVVFTENKLTYKVMNLRLCTTGLRLQQKRVRGVIFNSDGSLG